MGRRCRAQGNLVVREVDVCIRRQISHSAALLGIAIIGQLILFLIIRYYISVAVGRPDSINIGVAVIIGIFTGVFGILIGNIITRLFQHRNLVLDAAFQVVIFRLGFDHFVQDRIGAPANKDIGAVGKGMESHLAAGIGCRFIMV